jgi:peptidyl-prolyl cis-trans isomerase SurA
MRSFVALALMLPALAGTVGHAQAPPSPVILDHVVAVINGDVLLQSDVDEEMHFAALEPFQLSAGRDTRLTAMRRLISRTLILQQMKEQQQFIENVSNADVEKSLSELRSHLPECHKYDCASSTGWKAFLAANDLTSEEVADHWKQRLTVLRFIDDRFRTGIRVSQQSIADYYAKSVVPAFEKQGETAPPLSRVSERIQEILLEQQVNMQLQDWLTSLRGQGSVRILDPAYESVGQANSESKTSGDE